MQELNAAQSLFNGQIPIEASQQVQSLPGQTFPGAATSPFLGYAYPLQQSQSPQLAQLQQLQQDVLRGVFDDMRSALESGKLSWRTFAEIAIHALDKVVAELTPLYGADCPVAIVFRASWPDQRVVTGTLATIAEQLAADPIERTAIIFVGRALAAADFTESSLYDAYYQRRFRGREAL